MNEIKNLIKMSRALGKWRYVQAGGGNTSVKVGGTLYIKASGTRLSNMDERNGYVAADNNKVLGMLDTQDDSEIEFLSKDGTRPSIEIFLHAILEKYVAHTHDLSVNILTCRTTWQEELREIFANDDVLFIPYVTPGIKLGVVIKNAVATYDKIPNIIFLQNHGLIIHNNSANEVLSLHSYVEKKCWKYIKKTTKISSFIDYVPNIENIIDLDNNTFRDNTLAGIEINFLEEHVFCPDVAVYTDRKYTINNGLIIKAGSKQQALDVAELIAFKVAVLKFNIDQKINYLSAKECATLLGWDAEKYRVGIFEANKPK